MILFIFHIPHNGILFTIHQFILHLFIICIQFKPLSINVSEYNLYHCRANSMHPYMAHNTNIYNTFWPFFYLAFLLCSGLIWNIIPTNVPNNFNTFFLSFSISAWKYTHGTSKIATYLPSYTLITSTVNNISSDNVGDSRLFPSFKYHFCLLPFLQVLPLMILFIYLLGSRIIVLASFLHM